MINFIDKYIEKKLKKALHPRRNKIIKNTIKAYCQTHRINSQQIVELNKKLNVEAERVYAIVDKSILRERVKRAKYTFWISIIASTIIVGVLGGFSAGAVTPFIIPILTALVTWFVTLATIPISYNQRIQGSMDAIVAQFDTSLQTQPTLDNKNKAENELDLIKTTLQSMHREFENITNRIDMMCEEKQSHNHSHNIATIYSDIKDINKNGLFKPYREDITECAVQINNRLRQ